MDKVFEAIAGNIIVLAVFLVPICIVGITSYFSHKRLELVHRERLAAIEKGMMPPGRLTDPQEEKQLWKFVPASNWSSGTWTQITLPNNNLLINNSNGYGGLAVDPSHAGVLLLGTLDQYWPTGDVVYRSSDDGATWRDVSSVNRQDGNSKSPNLAAHDASLSPWLAFGQTTPLQANGTPANVSTGNWATSITIDPFDSNHAMYGTGQTIWTTDNLTVADPSASSTGVVNWTVGASGFVDFEPGRGDCFMRGIAPCFHESFAQPQRSF